jgi:hypothetical protein
MKSSEQFNTKLKIINFLFYNHQTHCQLSIVNYQLMKFDYKYNIL